MFSNRYARSTRRRKMVLPVTVIRRNGQEKQLAHTLDLTEVSARLGGLYSLLEPGETIEIQRGAVRASFQVFWMGAPGTAMEGQAGVRSVEPSKGIWGISLPEDEPDDSAGRSAMRAETQQTHTDPRPSRERRWHTRFECSGGASVRAEGSGFPVHGQVKDIARGGVYVETTTPLTLNTEIYVKMNVEGVPIESPGVVRTSYPMVGMGISFQNTSPENQERLDHVIQTIRSKSSTPKDVTEPALVASNPPKKESQPATTVLRLDSYPARILATALRMFAADFEEWKTQRAEAELDELRVALVELQHKVSLPQIDLTKVLASSVFQSKHA
jgi:hypothetical protein